MVEAWATFRSWPLRRHAGGILLLALLLFVRFADPLLAGQPVQDEEVYAAAFAKVAAGASPYDGLQFYYLPPFAVAGAWLTKTWGLGPTLYLLRVANLLALAGLLWLATGCWRLGFATRVGAAAVYGALAPAVHLALAWGNLSPLAISFWLLTFLLWRQRPLVAGASFALAMLVKPLAPIGLGLLALQRAPAEGWKGVRPQLLAAATATLLLLGALLPSPYLRDFLRLSGGIPAAARSASLHHLLYCFGLAPSALQLLIFVGALALFLLRRQRRGDLGLYVYAAIAGLLATPLVWSHTLLLVLPLQSAALALASQRHQQRRPGLPFELPLVGAALLAIQLSNGLGGIETWPLPVQGLFVLLPCFAPLGLALYLVAGLTANRPAPDLPAPP